jgi:hypothetical protein
LDKFPFFILTQTGDVIFEIGKYQPSKLIVMCENKMISYPQTGSP